MSRYLEEKVKYYDQEYRSGSALLITDKQFDHLENNSMGVNPKSDYFTNKKA